MKQGTVGTYGSESLPNITGGFGSGTLSKLTNTTSHTTSDVATQGAFLCTSVNTNSVVTDTTGASWFLNGWISYDANNSSTTYQTNAKVNPDNAEILYVIKY